MQIQNTALSTHAGLRRMGRMDLAWFLLMLHSGLRTSEVRSLRLQDIDWQRCQVRIEQSKGLKDRLVFLSQATVSALQDYLEVRGPLEALPDECFVFRHAVLSPGYCSQRLRTYGQYCHLGLRITPHQLRHSFATLLLNAGAPVATVQSLMGHQWIDTTLGYARLYDGTIAADYYQAMLLVEQRLALPEDALAPPMGAGQLIALVDSLRDGTLNPSQSAVLGQLRSGILALSAQLEVIEDVKVPAPLD